jgi:hypothetical protein
MKTKAIGAIFLCLFAASILSGCVTATNVRFEANVKDATVAIDGKKVGATPAQESLSNAIWEDPDVIVSKEGYKTLRTKLSKEVKPVNLICGIILFWPSLLWCYGPKAEQYFELIPGSDL